MTIDKDKEPWYHEGLRFECTGCGDCCSGEPGFVWVNKAEIQALADAIRVDVAEFERRYVRQVGIRKSLTERPGGDCVFLHAESRTCQVYQQRPRQCRTFPFWRSNSPPPPPGKLSAITAPAATAARSCRLSRFRPNWS